MSLRKAKKILILRFSSIGDIMLTTPVIRCLHEQIGCQVHFLTKAPYTGLIANNPHIDKVFSFDQSWNEVESELKNEDYDLLIDLHKNLRSWRIISSLKKPSQNYHKANVDKWMLVNLKYKKPIKHIVDRYFEALDIANDGKGLDYYFSASEEDHCNEKFNSIINQKYLIVNLGATHKTKRIPISKINDLLKHCKYQVILIGGGDVADEARGVTSKSNMINLVGQTSLPESAFLIKHATSMITGDSGMMHIGAAFHIPMMVLWGSTVPALGMYAYSGTKDNFHHNMEVTSLKCRPCSKIGKSSCPKGHFLCMNGIPVEKMASSMHILMNKS